jgi:hypothetical protein
MTQALEVKGYKERKKLGLCVRDRCEEKPEKNAAGERRSYCNTHAAANKKHADAWAARQGKTPKVKKAKVTKPKARGYEPGITEAVEEFVGVAKVTPALRFPFFTPEAISTVCEERALTRKTARQWLIRQGAKVTA